MHEENEILNNDKCWDEERRLLNIHHTIQVEPMDFIPAKFLYLNNHDYIENIICENIPLIPDAKGSYLKKEKLIQIIQQKKIKTKDSKFKFLDLILCNFHVSSSSIYSFSKTNDISQNCSKYIKSIPPYEDLFIDSSIFPFHQINCLYFFFEEQEIEKPPVLKSILKSPRKENQPKHTKKVRISLLSNNKEIISKKPRQTKKKRI